MKKTFIFIILIPLTLTSCSSLDKSMIYSGLAGAVLGGFVGRFASPNQESDKFNAMLGVAIGAGVGAGVGAYFFRQDPDNREMKTMLNSPSEKQAKLDKQKEFEIGIPISEKFYTVTPDTTKVPASLKDKVKKQIIIEKTIPERMVSGEGGKTTLIPETKIIEFDYQ